jgi:hypothetical protein
MAHRAINSSAVSVISAATRVLIWIHSKARAYEIYIEGGGLA